MRSIARSLTHRDETRSILPASADPDAQPSAAPNKGQNGIVLTQGAPPSHLCLLSEGPFRIFSLGSRQQPQSPPPTLHLLYLNRCGLLGLQTIQEAKSKRSGEDELAVASSNKLFPHGIEENPSPLFLLSEPFTHIPSLSWSLWKDPDVGWP